MDEVIAVQCRVPHRPEENKYGDCVRACVASILELDAEHVPHFYHDNPTPEVGMQRIRDYLRPSHTAFVTNYPPEPLNDLLLIMGEANPDTVYMLFGSVGEGDHVVICEGGKIIHNPAWIGCSLVGPGSHGFWQVMVIARR